MPRERDGLVELTGSEEYQRLHVKAGLAARGPAGSRRLPPGAAVTLSS